MVETSRRCWGPARASRSPASRCSRSSPRAGTACASRPAASPPRGLVGLLLPAGGNGLVTVAERDVPAGLAALLIASVPLWLVLMRSTVGRERGPHRAADAAARAPSASAAWALLLPGRQPPRPRPAASCSSACRRLVGDGILPLTRLSCRPIALVSTWQCAGGRRCCRVLARARRTTCVSSRGLGQVVLARLPGDRGSVALTVYGSSLPSRSPEPTPSQSARRGPARLGATVSGSVTVGTAAERARSSSCRWPHRQAAPRPACGADPDSRGSRARGLAEEQRCIKRPAARRLSSRHSPARRGSTMTLPRTCRHAHRLGHRCACNDAPAGPAHDETPGPLRDAAGSRARS